MNRLKRSPRCDSPRPPACTGQPTLLGLLTLDVVRGRPRLTLTVHCRHCHGAHHHGWGFDPLTPGEYPTEPTHREAHCWRPSSPYRRPNGRGYLVGPKMTTENETVLRQYAKLMRRLAPADDLRDLVAAAPTPPAAPPRE